MKITNIKTYRMQVPLVRPFRIALVSSLTQSAAWLRLRPMPASPVMVRALRDR